MLDFTNDGKEVMIYLEGRITSTNVADFEKDLFNIVSANQDITYALDVGKLEYISSAGLRVLLKMRRRSLENIVVQNASNEIFEIFEMTGFAKMFDVKKKLRQVSIEGCEIVGEGFSSKVYQLDADTIIKVYDTKVPMYKITREIDLAKKAFLLGLPTAISYDLVRCGEAYGVVFEMIANAVTVGKALAANNCAEFDDIMSKFAKLMQLMHTTEVDDSDGFPSIKGTWLDWADGMKKYYTAQEYDLLRKMVEAIPDRKTIVHCDFHAGNTLYQNGEIMVIDMADVGFAHPIIDFAAGAFHAFTSDQERIQKSLSLSQENILRFWDTLLKKYFRTTDIEGIKETFKAFALLRLALFPMKHIQITEEAKQVYIDSARKVFFPNIDWAMKQVKHLDNFFKFR